MFFDNSQIEIAGGEKPEGAGGRWRSWFPELQRSTSVAK
jgi:hypothetical protein